MNELERLERKSRLWHIEKAASRIFEFAQGRNREEYEADQLLRAAIERQFITIGEAMARAEEVDPDLLDQITDVPGIIAFRNQLIHNYPRVEAKRVWDIVHDNLPLLLSEVRALLAEP
jgi:uncharacterized protein with HEPN domain